MAPVSSDFGDPGQAAGSMEAHQQAVKRSAVTPSRALSPQGGLLTVCLWVEFCSPGE